MPGLPQRAEKRTVRNWTDGRPPDGGLNSGLGKRGRGLPTLPAPEIISVEAENLFLIRGQPGAPCGCRLQGNAEINVAAVFLRHDGRKRLRRLDQPLTGAEAIDRLIEGAGDGVGELQSGAAVMGMIFHQIRIEHLRYRLALLEVDLVPFLLETKVALIGPRLAVAKAATAGELDLDELPFAKIRHRASVTKGRHALQQEPHAPIVEPLLRRDFGGLLVAVLAHILLVRADSKAANGQVRHGRSDRIFPGWRQVAIVQVAPLSDAY